MIRGTLIHFAYVNNGKSEFRSAVFLKDCGSVWFCRCLKDNSEKTFCVSKMRRVRIVKTATNKTQNRIVKNAFFVDRADCADSIPAMWQ